MKRRWPLGVLVLMILLLAGCPAPGVGGGGPGPGHTFAEANNTLAAVTQGISMAVLSTNPSDPAWNTFDGVSLYTYHFTNYVSSTGITINGTVTFDAVTHIQNGTVTASGGSVKQVKYVNVTDIPSMGGYNETTFTDNSVWKLDYATGTFTEM